MKSHLVLTAIVIAIGNLHGEAPLAKQPEPTRTIDAELDASGRIVISKASGRAVSLKADRDFAMMIFYFRPDRGKPKPLPMYRVFLQPEHKVVSTQSLHELNKVLDRIPAGSTIYLYDYCTTGSHFGMPAKYMDAVEATCKSHKLKLADGGIICTCRG